ncbi:hypothetical protein F5J12DRAFT_778472 [Pisolithus orientalis]|uniref:uncharacterized protein n=1 Tax=Pisolithus orientalis TaxID=936130 RepID=UPI0022247444|nr:uncharacterized protein F5J12DRAFT_778472 [Pisolithus orientalis]KAI6034826.1 hypothetical protein F5J12DRAFT_778472 [Pisolithus orientalis]
MYNQPFPPLLQASGTSVPVLYTKPALPLLPQVSPVDDRLRAAAQMIQSVFVLDIISDHVKTKLVQRGHAGSLEGSMSDGGVQNGTPQRTLTNIHSDAAEAAQKYTEELLKLNDPSLLANPEKYCQWKEGEVTHVTMAFFLHEYNDQGAVIFWFRNAVLERFHTTFWYMHALLPIKHLEDHFQTTLLWMYSISAVALLCALHCEVNHMEGLHLQQPTFTSKEYAPLCEDYYEGMVDMLNNAAIGPTFHSHLDWLHLCSLEVSKTAIHMLASPCMQCTKIFIPPAEDITAYEAGPSFIPQPGPLSFVSQPGPSSFVPQPGPSLISQSAPSFVPRPGPSSKASTYQDRAAEYMWSEDQR